MRGKDEMQLVNFKARNGALRAIEKAFTFGSRVGACLYGKNGEIYEGFNIETRIHKGYHAEEVAIINALIHNQNMMDLVGIIIVYDFSKYDDNNIYPACASCRQYLWELTHPDLKIIVIGLDGRIRYEDKLKNLYPLPYPRKEDDKHEC